MTLRRMLVVLPIVASALLVNRPAVAFETLSDPLPSGGQGPVHLSLGAGRVVICGSLYLAGEVLALDEATWPR